LVKFPGIQIKLDLMRSLLIGLRRIQIQCRAKCRMSRKWQLLLDREDADFLSFPSFRGGVARQNERRLRKIHLPRQGLHLAVTQSSRVGENRQRITRQRGLREYVKLNEFVTAVRHEKTCIPKHARGTLICRVANS